MIDFANMTEQEHREWEKRVEESIQKMHDSWRVCARCGEKSPTVGDATGSMCITCSSRPTAEDMAIVINI